MPHEITHISLAVLQARELQDSDNAKALGHATGLRILLRSTLFKRLTVRLLDGHFQQTSVALQPAAIGRFEFMSGFHISVLLVV